jgi:protein archease
VSALDEVIYRLDADDEIPAAAQVTPAAGGGAWLVLALVPAGAAEIIGAVPKAVALHGLRCAADAAGRWSASVTIDV